jgi:S-adenosylmethionine hydrolase
LDGKTLSVNGSHIPQGRTFSDMPDGAAFWYRNSMGLVEIAVNRGRADQVLGLSLGQEIRFHP